MRAWTASADAARRLPLLAPVRSSDRLPFAAALLGFLAATAAPAWGQTAPRPDDGATAPNNPESDHPAVEVRLAPIEAATISDPDAPPLTEPRLVHRARRGLVAAGAATFGASYTAAALLAVAIAASGAAEPCASCDAQAATLLVPAAGPWLWWAKTAEYHRPSAVWPAVWSGVQTVGAAMLIIGLVGEDVWVRRPRSDAHRVTVVPALTGQLRGLALNVAW